MIQSNVYWIRLPDHDDILQQGYVGVANNVKKRWKVHKYSPENPHLKNAVKKYGWENLIKEVILTADRNYCEYIEERLRPEAGIGWNIVKGGGRPPILAGEKSHFFGKGHLISGKNSQFFKGPIVATNIFTGEKRIYNGNKELISAGFEQPNVHKCLRGERLTHQSHTFKRISP
jgi:hypothetical protein